jgi:hypothetical protein
MCCVASTFGRTSRARWEGPRARGRVWCLTWLVRPQVWVAGKDAIHESDVRVGITVEECEIGYVNDDFFNLHSTMLVVMSCVRDGSGSSGGNLRCLVINPHVSRSANKIPLAVYNSSHSNL